MSLIVWLPLNGDLNNQGLSNATVTASGATVNSSGKIGSCYSFDGSDDYISLIGDAVNNCFKGGTQQFSIAFWVYRADATRGIVLGDYGLTNAINFNLEFNTSHQFRFYWNGSPDKAFSAAVTASAWSHVVFTYNGTAIKYYLNGALKETYAITLSEKTKTSGAAWYLGRDSRTGTTALNGRLNDVRIYDHCLSTKEVKEISKGLVLHFPMDNNGLGNPNLVVNSQQLNNSFDSAGTSAWTRSYTDEDGQSIWTATCTTTGGGGVHTPLFPKATEKIGKQYTWSCRVKASRNVTLNMGSECGGTASKNITTEWQYFTHTWTFTDATYSSFVWYISGTWAVGDWLKVKDLKIEEGSKATPWCPNSADDLYSAWEMDSNIEHDCSGYGYNGTIVGTLTSKADSARHISCLYWPTATTASNYIKSSIVYTSGDAITLNIWFKSTSTGGSGYQMALTSSSRAYCELSITSGGALRAGLYVGGTRYVTNCSDPTLLDGNWHMLTITYDGTAIRRYVDAVAYATTSVTGTLNATAQSYYVGMLGGDTAYWSSDAYMSDARIYVTALSAADIKELYQIPISVDKDGNTFAMEYIEESSPNFYKAGIVENSYIHENEADDSDSLKTFHMSETKTFANQIYEV